MGIEYLIIFYVYKYPVLRLNDIKHLHVELTTKCNARCPMCIRNYRGGDFNSGYPETELSYEQFTAIVDARVIEILNAPLPMLDGYQPQWFGPQGVTFNGNLGDFCSARDGLEIAQYLVANGVKVSVNTNGSLRNERWWRSLGRLGISVGFALDGLADTHSLYRQDTDWHTVIRNAQTFIDAGGKAVWRFIPFDHNRHQQQICQEMAKELGFEAFENIYDGRDKTPVYTRHGKFSHHIGTLLSTENAEPPDWHSSIQSHITWYSKDRIKPEQDTPVLNMHCQHKRSREVYIAADGTVYPCCYLGFYPASMTHPGNQELKKIVHANNALEVGLEQAMAWFDNVEHSWSLPNIAEGRMYQCVMTCNKEPAHANH